MDNTVPLAAIGLVGTILAVVVKPLFSIIRENTTATRALVEETRKGNREAKQRNGHLAELVIQTNDKTIEAIKTVKKQEVKEQHVKLQTIDKAKK